MTTIENDLGFVSQLDPGLLELARTSRPTIQDGVVVVELSDRLLVWGARGAPGVLGMLAAALWPFFDGSATVEELAADLAFAADVHVDMALEFVVNLELDLAYNGLIDGAAELIDHVAATAAALADDTQDPHYEVIDGTTYYVTEHVLTHRQLEGLVGPLASPLELAEPDGCAGRRLQLDRPAELAALALGGTPLTVRTTDAELADRLRVATDGADPRGPVVAFVTSDGSGVGQRRYALYNTLGHLVGATQSLDDLETAVWRVLADFVPGQPSTSAVEWIGHVLIRDGVAVLAPMGAFQRPRGLLRQITRAGITLDPGTRAFIDSDSATVWLPQLAPERREGAVTWRSLPIVGVWARGNRVDSINLAQMVAVMVRASNPAGAPDRRALVETMTTLAGTLPTRVGFNESASSHVTAIVADLDHLLSAGPAGGPIFT